MSVKIKNRHRLKSKEIRNILNELQQIFHDDFFGKKSSIETGSIEGIDVILVDDEVDFIINDERIFFTIRGLNKYNPKEHRVVVDMGAIKFITNGADVMTAGIVDADPNIQEDDQVWICDETHHKPLAVGIALISGEEMVSQKEGKAIKNIHYIGDRLWTLTG